MAADVWLIFVLKSLFGRFGMCQDVGRFFVERFVSNIWEETTGAKACSKSFHKLLSHKPSPWPKYMFRIEWLSPIPQTWTDWDSLELPQPLSTISQALVLILGLGRFSAQTIGSDMPLGDEDILPSIARDAADGVVCCWEALALGLSAQGTEEKAVLDSSGTIRIIVQ